MNKRELTRLAHRMMAEWLRGCDLQPGELSEADAEKWVAIVEAIAERHDRLAGSVTMSWREVR